MKRTELKRAVPMKRSGSIRPKPRRRPDVDWPAVRATTYDRDIRHITIHVRRRFGLETLEGSFSRGRLIFFTQFGPMQWCMAPVLDPAEEGKCEGVATLNHVQNPSDPMYGRKVPDEPGFLVFLCTWHHQGSKAGHVWATASENIALQWDYLKEATSG